MRILISAYACSPAEGSEPGVGWGFVCALSKLHDLHVIVESRFRGAIEKFVREHPSDTVSRRVAFFYIDRQRSVKLEQIWPPAYYTTYREWHKEAYKLACALHMREKFDLAHQLTMVGFREPGYLWKLGIPFVWGPFGGMGLFPWRFIAQIGAYGALYFLGYNLLNLWQMRFAVRPKLAAHHAAQGLIAMNTENREGAARYFGISCPTCIPVGPPVSMGRPTTRLPDEPLRIIWIGRLQPGKALNLALRALARVSKTVKWELHVLGNGPMRVKWKRLAQRLGMMERCSFHGQVSRDIVLDIARRAHVHLLTSLREGTPSVVVEAGAFGLPTVCLNISGMRDMVDETCGIKIQVTTPRKVIDELAAAITQLGDDEPRRHRLSVGAFERAQDFSWNKKVQTIEDIYQSRIAGAKISY